MKVLRRLMSWLIDHRTTNSRVGKSKIGNSRVGNRIDTVLSVDIYLSDRQLSHD